MNCSSSFISTNNVISGSTSSGSVSATCSNRGYCNPSNPKCVCNAAGGVGNQMASGINCATLSCPVVSIYEYVYT